MKELRGAPANGSKLGQGHLESSLRLNSTPNPPDAPPVTAINLTTLETRIDELVRSLNELTEENRALRDQQGNLMAERAALIEKSELARSRVEAMIARLKAMEINT